MTKSKYVPLAPEAEPTPALEEQPDVAELPTPPDLNGKRKNPVRNWPADTIAADLARLNAAE